MITEETIKLILDAYLKGYTDKADKRESKAWDYITELMKGEKHEDN